MYHRTLKSIERIEKDEQITLKGYVPYSKKKSISGLEVGERKSTNSCLYLLINKFQLIFMVL